MAMSDRQTTAEISGGSQESDSERCRCGPGRLGGRRLLRRVTVITTRPVARAEPHPRQDPTVPGSYVCVRAADKGSLRGRGAVEHGGDWESWPSARVTRGTCPRAHARRGEDAQCPDRGPLPRDKPVKATTGSRVAVRRSSRGEAAPARQGPLFQPQAGGSRVARAVVSLASEHSSVSVPGVRHDRGDAAVHARHSK